MRSRDVRHRMNEIYMWLSSVIYNPQSVRVAFRKPTHVPKFNFLSKYQDCRNYTLEFTEVIPHLLGVLFIEFISIINKNKAVDMLVLQSGLDTWSSLSTGSSHACRGGQTENSH